MLEAILFDLDGLLVDSEPAWLRARQDLAAEHGAVWTEEMQRAQAGVHTDVWTENVRACIGGALTASEVQEAIVSRMEHYYLAGEVALMPGAEDCIRRCSRSCRLALASGSPHRLIRAAVTGAGWADVFELVASSDEVGAGKPDPAVYLHAAERLAVSPASALVVEDSGAGIRAGKAAGAMVAAVPAAATHPGEERLAEADFILDSLTELPGLVQSLKEGGGYARGA